MVFLTGLQRGEDSVLHKILQVAPGETANYICLYESIQCTCLRQLFECAHYSCASSEVMSRILLTMTVHMGGFSLSLTDLNKY